MRTDTSGENVDLAIQTLGRLQASATDAAVAHSQPPYANCLRAEAELAIREGKATHSVDFASVWWFGTYYEFTPLQAGVVSVLWAAWENGAPGVGQPHLLRHAGAPPTIRLANIFHTSKAWGEMIVCSRKNVYRLDVPDNSFKQRSVIVPVLLACRNR